MVTHPYSFIQTHTYTDSHDTTKSYHSSLICKVRNKIISSLIEGVHGTIFVWLHLLITPIIKTHAQNEHSHI